MPNFGDFRIDPNGYDQQAWDGNDWISVYDFRDKYGFPDNSTQNNSPITDKQLNRSYNTGDYAITGQSSNGINVTKDGNIFQYTGNNKEFLANLAKAGANLALNPNDPNNIGSFIGMFVTGNTNIKLGSTNQQTLNKNTEKPKDVVTADKKVEKKPGKGILIGDSFCYSVEKNSKLLQPLTKEGVLWKVGINTKTLNKMVSAYNTDDTITHVFISMGSNDTYLEVEKGITKTLVNTLHTKFPNASLYVFKGDYDSKNVYDPLHDGGSDYFGNKIDKILPRRDNYYATFWTPLGVTVMKNDVGDVQKHAGPSTPGIIAIGHEIDSILGSSELPVKEVKTTYTPKVVKKAEAITSVTGEEEADIMQEEYKNLPTEEGTQLFEIIKVTDTSVVDIKFENFEIYKQYFQIKINNDNIKYKKNEGGDGGNGGGGKVSAAPDNYKMDGDRISPEQCEVYYGDKVPYIAQLNNWGCLVTSISMMAPACGVNITQTMFYGSDLIRKAPYIDSGNNLNLSRLQQDYPRLQRVTDYDAKLTRANIFQKYKTDIRNYKKPIIIRMRGCSNPGRGHYVVAVGITKDGNIIIHNPARRAIAFKDNVIGSNVLLGSDQRSDNGKNYDILYFQ